MHSEYDENLRQNTFFNELVKNHSDIITKVAEDNWVICIPRSGTLESTDIDINIVLDHVLIPSDDGLVGTFQIFSTLSKKQLHIKQNEILLGDCQFFSNVVNILFKETFYEKKGSKYTVWCIDKPFFLDHLHSPSNLQVLETLPDCIDFLWVESLDQDILQQIQNLCLKFTESNPNYEWEHIQTQKDLIGSLYSRCLQKSLRINNIREKGANSDQYLEKIKLAVETYMQYCLYKKIIFGINTFYVQSDVYLNKIINRAQDVSDENLEIEPSYNAILSRAKSELGKLNNSVTILDKVNCLDRTFNTLCSCNNGNSITSDDLLQMFVSLILKLHTYNWISTLNFIRDFKFCTSTFTDHVNYLLTTLEAAIEYIKGNHFFNLCKMASYYISNESNIFHFVRMGNLIALKELFENSENNDLRIKLCHPLCLCDECEKITKDILIDKEIKNEKKQTLLTYATIHEKTEIVEYLLNKDLNVNWQDIFGKTALHYASERGYQDILLLLLSVETIDINIQDNKGNTPLHIATGRAQDNCVKALIYSSPHLNTNVHNNYGEIPLIIAAKEGYLSIVQILLENCGVPPSDSDIQSTIQNSHNYFIKNYIEQFCIEKLLLSFQYQDIESEPEDNNKSVETNCSHDAEIQVNLKKLIF
ncbi:hypothetical protein WA026_010800 [Henosepilachna vigintioctopunctata]|uniref:VPS9 domain-containing protein n=1 Tax=Henosepilachna vigintioctopunctata TaxID=420089 RepID=A0AAW1UWT6_9CUCU